MNKTEHLLTCLAEECAEVQQAVTKALRFGLDDNFKETTPAQDIVRECIEVIAVIKLLEEEGLIEIIGALEAIEQKKAKIRHYMQYAKERGTLISS